MASAPSSCCGTRSASPRRNLNPNPNPNPNHNPSPSPSPSPSPNQERLVTEGCRHTKGGSTTEALAELGPVSGARYVATYGGACEGRPQSLDELLVTPAQLVVLVQHFLPNPNPNPNPNAKL